FRWSWFCLQAAYFGGTAADDAVGLGSGAVHRGLGAEEVGFEHGVGCGLAGEGGFDFGAAAESPGGTDEFGGKEFLKRGLRAKVIPEGEGEGFVFFGF